MVGTIISKPQRRIAMNESTYTISGSYATMSTPALPGLRYRVEIYRQPEIGQKYKVVYFCDNDNASNYTVEVTEANIAEVTYRMNDPKNDITEYILIEK